MKKAMIAAAQAAALGVTGMAAMATLGVGAAAAAPQDCAVQRDLTGASATCPADDGVEYVLHVDCFGLYASGPFPLYAIGPYVSKSYPFTPNGQQITAGCTGMGPGVVAVATNAYAEIYRR